MGKGADSSSPPQNCPLRDKMVMRSPVPASVLNNNIPKHGFNFDTKKKHCSVPEAASRPCYPLSGLQRLLKNFRKPDQQEEPKSVGLSIVIENSWSTTYSCCKNQSKSVSGYTKDRPAKITPACKSKPQIVNKSMVAAQCKDRPPNGSSKHRSSVLLSPTSAVYSNVVASTPLPPIDFLDACYLCKRSLGPGLDIYMYRGDRAFCSVECRLKQMAMDEQSEKCASAAIKRAVTTTSPRSRRSDGNRTHVQARGLTTAA